jgi:AAHS family 4-hydroxybenzoate transporter-like MFS transporter
MIFCLLLFGACVLVTPLAANAQQLFVLRVLTGLGLGGVMPNAIAISMEFAPSRLRASMVSFTYFGFIIGGAAGGIVAATLIPLMGWKGMIFVVGLLPLTLALVQFFFLPESPEYRAHKEGRTNRTNSIDNDRGDGTSESANHGVASGSSPMREIFSLENRRNSALMWLAMFANLSVAFGVLQWLPTLLNQAGFTLGSASSLVALSWISTVPGVILLLYVAKMVGLPRAVGLFLCVGSVVTFGLGVVIATAASDAVWLLMVGIGMTVTAAQVGFYSLLSAVYPGSSRVTGIGWAQGVGRLGAVVGPSAIGFLLAGGTSTVALFTYVSIPVLISAVAVWQVRPLRLAA